MGWWNSRIEKAEMVVRCKARKGYMKDLVKARQSFSGAHSMYLRSLRNTGSALLQFVMAETRLHHKQGSSIVIDPPPLNTCPPPMSPSSTHWCTTSTATSSTLPPPPPPPISSSVWDFFDPFFPTSGRIDFKDEWEDTTTTTVITAGMAEPQSTTTTAADSNVVGQVVSTNTKDLEEIIKELDEYFLKTADSGGPPSLLLEVPTTTSTFADQRSSSGRFHLAKWNAFGNFCDQSKGVMNVGVAGSSHGSTVEKLYVWEKKLYLEVKTAETLRLEHVKKFDQLRKPELKSADNPKTETAKKELEKVESRMEVNSQAIESTSAEIINLREKELYPQLVELVKGLFCMWRSMYECHHEQTHIVQQLKYLNTNPSSEQTFEIHRQSALQLELQVQQWHLSFNNLVKAQRDYVQSLTGWLRLSLFQVGSKPIEKSGQDSTIYSLCEEWQLAVNNAPGKVASEGIKSFYSVINAIVLQHAEELKQKKRFEATFKQLERKNAQLKELETKYGPYLIDESSARNRNPISEKRAKVETLRAKAEEEKERYDKLLNVTRTMTMSNLQMGLPHVFQAVTGFANMYTHRLEPVYNQAKCIGA